MEQKGGECSGHVRAAATETSYLYCSGCYCYWCASQFDLIAIMTRGGPWGKLLCTSRIICMMSQYLTIS